MGIEESPDVLQDFVLLGCWQSGDVADASDPVDDPGRRARVLMAERLAVERTELPAFAESGITPVVVFAPGRLPLDVVHDGPYPLDPVDRTVTGVPDEPDPPPGRRTLASSPKASSASNQKTR